MATFIKRLPAVLLAILLLLLGLAGLFLSICGGGLLMFMANGMGILIFAFGALVFWAAYCGFAYVVPRWIWWPAQPTHTATDQAVSSKPDKVAEHEP